MKFKQFEIVEGELKHIDVEIPVNSDSMSDSISMGEYIRSKIGEDVVIKDVSFKTHFLEPSKCFERVYVYEVTYAETTKTEKTFTNQDVWGIFLSDFWKSKSTDKIKYEVDHS